MKQKINIAIPEPCHENWQKMNPTEKGRFCDSCQKNVFDFTKATDRQIMEAYNQNQNLCGRFLNTQLNRDLAVPKEKSSVWLATTSAIISFLALGNHEIAAQECVKTEQTQNRVLLGKPARNIDPQEKEVTGIVADGSGPLPGVNVVVKGTLRGVATDFDGAYSIKAKEGETLVFSFMGMQEESVVIGRSTKYDLIMKDGGRLTGEVVVTKMGMGIKKRKTFFGRIFSKIGNVFK